MKALPPRIAVATSGGRDSAALLHCTVRAAAALGVQVTALHVHHGLVAGADEWVAHVRRQALRWGAGFDMRRLKGVPGPGDSIEAWARRERYAALAEMAHAAGCPLVLLAHHRRDQAETWLLQALRGAGPAGLNDSRDNAKIAVGGLVLMRQRPGTAKGTVFLTLEDETGGANIIVWAKAFEANRRLVMTASLLVVYGRLQKANGVIHLVADRFVDLTPRLARLKREADDIAPDRSPVRGALVRSRDFH